MSSWGADHRWRFLVFAAPLTLLVLFLWPGAGSPAGAQESCEKEPSGASQTFEYTGKKATFKVPAKFGSVTIRAIGGHGGQDDHTAAGGKGAMVETVVPVTPGECLTVYVGGYGHYDGGWGYAKGGKHGTASGISAGHSAGGGGGASAVLRGSTPLVVAGGGGGGGGDASEHPNWGGKGGAGGNTAGGNGADGVGPGGGAGGEGGAYYDSELPEGHNDGFPGENVGASDIGAGAGGGGGGGIAPNEPGFSGGAGGGGDHGKGPDINPPHQRRERETSAGGGGGGGGGSIVGPHARGTKYLPSPRACPAGQSPKTCAGQVVFEWNTGPDHVAVLSGSGQSVGVEGNFPRPLAARVTNYAGKPLPGVTVEFTLPHSGPSAVFLEREEERRYLGKTNAEGIAVSGPLGANEFGGEWEARASVEGFFTTAVYKMKNTAVATAVDLSASANPSIAGQQVRFTATINGPFQPFGKVQFEVDGKNLGAPVAVDEVSSKAVSPATALIPGKHTIEADFLGNASYTTSTGKLTQQTNKATTAVAVASSKNPAVADEPISFTAAVSKQKQTASTPTGTVQFSVDGAARGGPVPLAANGTATLAGVADLAVGEHTIGAAYSGDGEFLGAAGTMREAIGADRSATQVSVEPAPATHGQPLDLSVSVASLQFGGPTGSVTVGIEGGPSCGSIPLDPSGAAHCTIAAPVAAGRQVVRASYAGDGTVAPSAGTAEIQIVPASTSVVVSAEPGAVAFGNPVGLKAKVLTLAPGSGTPTGAVQFRRDGSAVGAPVTLREGIATGPKLPEPPAGLHTIEAVYVGASNFMPSTDAAVLTVNQAKPTSTLTASANPISLGRSVVLTAAVAPGPRSSAQPPGLVQFNVDGRDRGAPVKITGGVAKLSTSSSLTAGTHEIRAYYEGNANFAAANAGLGLLVLPVVGPSGQQGTGGGPAGGGPAPSHVLLATGQAKVTPGGAVAVKLTCSGVSACAGSLTLTARQGSIGTAPFALGAGSTQAVRLRLNRRGAQMISRGSKGAVVATAQQLGGPPESSPLKLRAGRSPSLVVVGAAAIPVDPQGHVPVPLACHATKHRLCSGQLTLQAADGHRIGVRNLAVRAGRLATAHIRLDRHAAEELVRAGRIQVRARATSRTRFGLPRVAIRRLTIVPSATAGP